MCRGANAADLSTHHDLGVDPLASERQELFPINRNLARRFNAESDVVAIDLHDRHDDRVANYDPLTQFAAQNQHDNPPCFELGPLGPTRFLEITLAAKVTAASMG